MKKPHIKNVWLHACIAGLLAAAVSALLALPAAKLMEAGVLPIKWSTAAAYCILGVSACTGALIAAGKGRQRILLLCLAESSVFYLTLIVMNGILQQGQFERIWQTALIVFGISAVIGILSAGKKRRFR